MADSKTPDVQKMYTWDKGCYLVWHATVVDTFALSYATRTALSSLAMQLK